MKIEAGVPVPSKFYEPRTEEGRTAKVMKHMDSVLCATEKESDRLRMALRHIGAKSVRRKSGDGWRVWRIDGDSLQG